MTRTFPDWVYLNDASGAHWYHVTKGTRTPVDGLNGDRPPVRAVYAIPSKDLVSNPHWVSSKEPAIINQVISAENEKLGLKVSDGPGRVSDWSPVKLNGTRTLVQSVAIPWEFTLPMEKSTEFTDFVPQYALFSPPENAIVLWREGNEWVVGYSREGRWAHIQPLGNLTPEEIVGEIQLTLMELNAKGIVSKLSEVVVWGENNIPLLAALRTLPRLLVEFRPFPAPNTQHAISWRFEPHEVSLERSRAQRRKKIIASILLGFLLLVSLSAGAFAHLWTLQRNNGIFAQRIADNRESADTIASAMEQWRSLSPAIEPERTAVELFYQVATLLPERGVRLTSFEIQNHRTISIRGEASTMSAGLKLKADLQQAPGLSDYEWEDFQPRQKGDILEFNAIGRYRFAE